MHRLRRTFLLQALMTFDAVVVVAALAMGLFVSTGAAGAAALEDLLSLRITVTDGALALFFLLACHRVFDHCGLYRSRRLGSRRQLYGQIAKAVSMATLLLGTLGVVCRIEAVNGAVLGVFWVAGLAVIATSRVVLYRCLEALRRQGRNLRNALIVGAGPRGLRFAAALESRVELGYRVVGFLDQGNGAARAGVRLLGGFDDLNELLGSGQVDEVAVALPMKSFYSDVSRIVALCERRGVVVRLPGDLFDTRLARVESEQFEDLSVLTLFTGRGSALCFLVKRAADVVLSAAGLVLLAPLIALIALAIQLDSGGPVLFRQIRVGYNGRRFWMLKFRTMTPDAEARQPELEPLNEVRGAAFKIRNDPRLTRVGRWLRRTSLDELPQLIHVLKGEMSLVGPRPLPLRDVDRLNEDWQRRRFSVRPGLTCLWQTGGRHLLGFDEWMRLDLDYIDNWSLLLDLKILLRTLPAMWTGAGAS